MLMRNWILNRLVRDDRLDSQSSFIATHAGARGEQTAGRGNRKKGEC